MSDRDLLALIHDKAGNILSAQKIFPDIGSDTMFGRMEEIWNLTKEAYDQVHGPSGDDGRDFTAPYEP